MHMAICSFITAIIIRGEITAGKEYETQHVSGSKRKQDTFESIKTENVQ